METYMTLKRTYNLKIDTARAEYHSEDVKAEIAGILHGKKNYVEDSRTEQAFDTNCGLLDEVAKCFKLLRWNTKHTFYSPFDECPGQCQLTPGHLLGVKKNGFSSSEN